MTTEFQQKRGMSSRKFKLTHDKVIVETKTLSKIDKYDVKLYELGFDIHYQADNTLVGKIALGICSTLAIGSIVGFFLSTEDANVWIFNAVLFAFFAFVSYFKKHQDDIFLVGGNKKLAFYREIPNEKAVLEFIEKIKEQKKV